MTMGSMARYTRILTTWNLFRRAETMNRIRPLLIALFTTMLTILILSSDADACRRRNRRCQVCESCPGIPSWVRCYTPSSDTDRGPCQSPDGTVSVCWCCAPGGAPVDCGQCPAGAFQFCLPQGQQPMPGICPPGFLRTADESSQNQRLCAMICDCHTHALRFAYPCEKSGLGYGYYPIQFLGVSCHAATK